MKNIKNNIIFIIILIGLSLVACDIDPEKKKKERSKLIDKLTKERTTTLALEMDSLCQLKDSLEFEYLVDSVLNARIDEIRNKMKEYQ